MKLKTEQSNFELKQYKLHLIDGIKGKLTEVHQGKFAVQWTLFSLIYKLNINTKLW